MCILQVHLKLITLFDTMKAVDILIKIFDFIQLVFINSQIVNNNLFKAVKYFRLTIIILIRNEIITLQSKILKIKSSILV